MQRLLQFLGLSKKKATPKQEKVVETPVVKDKPQYEPPKNHAKHRCTRKFRHRKARAKNRTAKHQRVYNKMHS